MRKGKSGQSRKRVCERRKSLSEGENSHAKKKIIRTGTSVRVVCAAREIYREKRAQKGKNLTHSRYFGRRAMKIKVRAKG